MNSLEGLIHVWELWYNVGHLFASACCVLAESLAVCGGTAGGACAGDETGTS